MLEDDFIDVLAKALHGRGASLADLATALHRDLATLQAWAKGSAIPDDAATAAIAEFLHLDARALVASVHGGALPDAALPPSIELYSQSPQPSNGYLLHAHDDSAIVDPAGDVDALLRRLGERRLRYILVTHRHADHCDAVENLQTARPMAQLVMAPLEAQAANLDPAIAAKPGVSLPFGTTEISIDSAPGHTDGATLFAFDASLFVGDVMFSGSVGRLFGPTTSYAEQLQNIRKKILARDATTLILPGHGPATTVEFERRHNPFFSHASA